MAYSALERAEAFIQAGELDDALEALNEHLAAAPHEDSALRLRAAVLMRMHGDEPKQAALADLRALQQPTADDFVLESILLQGSEPDAALAALVRARSLKPDDESLIQRHIYMLMTPARFAEVRALLDSMPKTWLWLRMSGELAAEYEGEERAITDYTAALKALDAMPTSGADGAFYNAERAHVLSRRANAYATLNRFEEGDADLVAQQALTPDDPMIPFFRGLIAADRGDLTSALAFCGDAFAMTTSDFLRDSMENMLRSNPRYAALAVLLLAGDADI